LLQYYEDKPVFEYEIMTAYSEVLAKTQSKPV